VRSYLVTEGKTDVAILAPILQALGLTDVVVRDAGGKAMTTSLARSLAVARRAPVAVVVDADTTNESLIRQQSAIFVDLTSTFAGPTDCKLFQAVPTLGEALFPSVRDFEDLFGDKLSASDRELFQRDRDVFLRQWAGAEAKSDRASQINAAKAREAFEGSGLFGLVDYLTQADRHVTAAQ
jgi:hypothetical protein